jgi:predicted SAM-dependent methyltransferase
MKKVLNVGGNNRYIGIPDLYNGWECHLLDIDASAGPEICCDARELVTHKADIYDSVYCSHNLEHYQRRDALTVLNGIAHVLKPAGFLYVIVPDLIAVIKEVVARGLDLEETLYDSPAGPITPLDVIYGLQSQVVGSDNPFFAHKNGFSEKSLRRLLSEGGFDPVHLRPGPLELHAIGFLQPPTEACKRLLGLPA